MVAGLATLQEIETHWSIDDLADAQEILDLQDQARREAEREAKRNLKSI